MCATTRTVPRDRRDASISEACRRVGEPPLEPGGPAFGGAVGQPLVERHDVLAFTAASIAVAIWCTSAGGVTKGGIA